MKARVIAPEGLRVRLGPGTQFATVGVLPFNTSPEIDSVDNGWAKISLTAGGVTLVKSELATYPPYVYAMASYLETGPPVEPPKAQKFKLGFHVMQNTGLAVQEASNKVEFFMVMNDIGGASNLKRAFPNATVMVRKFTDHRGRLSLQQSIDLLEGVGYPDLVYTLYNENDNLSDNGQGLVDRAQADIELATWIKKNRPGALFAGGTFSMGCPDFTNAETCRIIRELYAPAYNSGLMGFDMHLYDPSLRAMDGWYRNSKGEWAFTGPAGHVWFRRRWEFLFASRFGVGGCGFDPKIRAIYCSETGVDEMGIGGFPAHGVNLETVKRWALDYVKSQEEPLVINNVSYPSPIIGGAIFQKGGNGDPRWGGYEMNGLEKPIREVAVR